MHPPVFIFTAYSGTGKTTYIEKLVAELKGRGLKVAIIKHDAHKFEIDKEGKDTWRFAKAGADVVAISSDEKFALIKQRCMELDGILGHIKDVDIIITEGWHGEDYPKIGVFRAGSGSPLKGEPEDFVAIVSDTPMKTSTPVFPLDDPAPLSDFLLESVSII